MPAVSRLPPGRQASKAASPSVQASARACGKNGEREGEDAETSGLGRRIAPGAWPGTSAPRGSYDRSPADPPSRARTCAPRFSIRRRRSNAAVCREKRDGGADGTRGSGPSAPRETRVRGTQRLQNASCGTTETWVAGGMGAAGQAWFEPSKIRGAGRRELGMSVAVLVTGYALRELEGGHSGQRKFCFCSKSRPHPCQVDFRTNGERNDLPRLERYADKVLRRPSGAQLSRLGKICKRAQVLRPTRESWRESHIPPVNGRTATSRGSDEPINGCASPRRRRVCAREAAARPARRLAQEKQEHGKRSVQTLVPVCLTQQHCLQRKARMRQRFARSCPTQREPTAGEARYSTLRHMRRPQRIT
jgi:hypothetical protein